MTILNEYYSNNKGKLYLGDCLDVMKELPENSIDFVVSDPPYGLTNINAIDLIRNEELKGKGFMGKEWDNIPTTEILKECLRVLKPGAFAFWLFTPRQDALTVFNYRLMQAGFNINFTSLYWIYASGMPKSLNIAKSVDRKLGVEQEVIGKAKRMGKQNPEWNGTANGRSENFLKPEYNKTKVTSEQAKRLDGWFTFSPKPAVEIIVSSMKPFEEGVKSYTEQAMTNGHGCVNFDACRIPFVSEADKKGAEIGFDNDDLANKLHAAKNTKGGFGHKEVIQNELNNKGRFPSNVITTDKTLNSYGTTKSGYMNPEIHQRIKSSGDNYQGLCYGAINNDKRGLNETYGDEGSINRFFDIEAWWQERIKDLPENVQKILPVIYCPKPAKSEKNKGCEKLKKEVGHNRSDTCETCGGTIFQNPDRPSACKCEAPIKQNNIIKGNFHVSVKPITLMSYLITLGSRENDVILDPFAGSGTTLLSAQMLNRNFVGMELNEEYCEIAKLRLQDYNKQIRMFE